VSLVAAVYVHVADEWTGSDRPSSIRHMLVFQAFYQAYDSKMKFCCPVVALLFHSIKRTAHVPWLLSRQQHQDGAIVDYSKELPRGINFNSVPRFISSKSSCPHFSFKWNFANISLTPSVHIPSVIHCDERLQFLSIVILFIFVQVQ
jgi:hypothetical protein